MLRWASRSLPISCCERHPHPHPPSNRVARRDARCVDGGRWRAIGVASITGMPEMADLLLPARRTN